MTPSTAIAPAPADTAGQPARLTVVGTGDLDATHAICLAVLGFEVLRVDIDADKDRWRRSGEVPIFEAGLPEMLAKALESGRLRFTTDSRKRQPSAACTSSAWGRPRPEQEQ